MIALKFSIDQSDDFLKLESDKTVLCMSSCLNENVPAACNDTVSADKFLLLLMCLLVVQGLYEYGYRILIILTGGQCQPESAGLSITNIPE